ncbi:MAG: hypothetical protein ABW022_22530, partial [Actinoplanes sp.]
MTMVDDDEVYRTRRRRAQRRKKFAVAVAGLAAILAGGGYAVSAYRAAQDSTIIGGSGALGPAVTPDVAEPTTSAPTTSAARKPSAGSSRCATVIVPAVATNQWR